MFSKGASFDLRLLDHGVCSGLLLLQFITSYYQIVVGLNEVTIDGSDKKLVKSFLSRGGEPYEARYWWQGMVWATASIISNKAVRSGPTKNSHGSESRRILLPTSESSSTASKNGTDTLHPEAL